MLTEGQGGGACGPVQCSGAWVRALMQRGMPVPGVDVIVTTLPTWRKGGGGGQGFFRIIKNQGGGGPLPQNPLPPSPDQSDHSAKKRNLQ